MHDESRAFQLSCTEAGSPAPVLTDVQAHGRLDPLLFDLTLRQRYRNTSDRVLEVVYTFPLPVSTVLLGFASELNGVRLQGVITPRQVAERRYETALQAGDAPVMLEQQGNGLYTANIGNLKPGDEVVLETRFAKITQFEGGRLRVAIPTTIAPRYGNPAQSGLQPQHVPPVSLLAEYPLSLSLAIGPALAGAALECPTHAFSVRPQEGGSTLLELSPGARMDREVVVIVTPREVHPSLLARAADPFDASAPVVTMALLQPRGEAMKQPRRESLALKLLVDCSGSMAGDSITSARAALRGAVAGLSSKDQLSLSLFGDRVEHLMAPTSATPQALRFLLPQIDHIQADLGGTEMDRALHSVFALPTPEGAGGADVLLITDGQVWPNSALLAAARASGHRVFAIGVGAAPVANLLKSLAESTGGACEFATPGEALEAAARRMLERMRQPKLANIRIDWGCTPVWSWMPTYAVYGGDTVAGLAGMSGATPSAPVRLLADDEQGRTVELARSEADVPCPGDALARLAANWRLAGSDRAAAQALAVQYQLMSPHTHCILVHERSEAERVTEQAELHRVSSMLAAGWGGLGRVEAACAMFDAPLFAGSLRPAALRMPPGTFVASPVRELSDLPSFPGQPSRAEGEASIDDMVQAISRHLSAHGRLDGLLATCASLTLNDEVRLAFEEVVQLGLREEQAWVLLADWVGAQLHGMTNPDDLALLEELVDAIDAEQRAEVQQVFNRRLLDFAREAYPAAAKPLRSAP
jgi:Ca-activated chloride channel family protein